jgi:hypothetical protein
MRRVRTKGFDGLIREFLVECRRREVAAFFCFGPLVEQEGVNDRQGVFHHHFVLHILRIQYIAICFQSTCYDNRIKQLEIIFADQRNGQHHSYSAYVSANTILHQVLPQIRYLLLAKSKFTLTDISNLDQYLGVYQRALR